VVGRNAFALALPGFNLGDLEEAAEGEWLEDKTIKTVFSFQSNGYNG
jgi:hypothetical protein